MSQTNEEKVKYCLDWIEKIQGAQGTIDEDREEALKFFRGDSSIVPALKGRSKAVTTDLLDTIEWLKPSLMEIFAGREEVGSIGATGEEDHKEAKKVHKLVNYQIRVKNKWFLIWHDFVDNALKLKIGILKYQWFTDTKFFDKDYKDLTDQEYAVLKNNPDTIELAHEQIEIGRMQIPEPPYEKLIYSHNATFQHVMTDSFPLIEAVPPEEFGFCYTAREIKDTFCFHKVKISKYEFIKEYGQAVFNKIENYKSKDEGESNTVGDERFKDLGGLSFLYNEKEDKYNIYECYFNDPKTNIPWIRRICADEELRDEKNKYGGPPFILGTPIRIAHRIIGLGMYDLCKNIQKIRTSLLRGILNNINTLNARRYFGDPARFNVKDYLENNTPDALIRTEGDPTGIVVPEIKTPLPGEVFAFWEMMNIEKDYHTGVPRSFQGVNTQVLNRTFRGQAQQINQASQRVSLITRLLAEQAIVPLIEAVIDLNIRFLDKKTSFRYLNEYITISPDNLIGKYDITVNVGTGGVDNEQTIIHMQQLLGLFSKFKIANGGDIYNVFKELIQAMKRKNVHDFITDPKFNEGVLMLIQIVVEAGLPQQDPRIAELVKQLMAGLQQEEVSQSSQEPAQPREPTQDSVTPAGGDYFG